MSGILGHRGILLNTAVGPTDPYIANVTSLIHFPGANGSTTIVDERGITWSPVSPAQISTAQSVFGGSSLRNSSNSSINAPTAGNFDFGTGDLTVELRARFDNFSGFPSLFDNRGGSGGITFRALTGGTGFQFFYGAGTGAVSASVSLSTNTWYAFAFTRSGSTIYLFLDGVMVQSGSIGAANITSGSSSFTNIGAYAAGGSDYMTGYVDEFRATKGVCRYTSNYTVDTAEFPNS